jgi:hypothetical protein
LCGVQTTDPKKKFQGAPRVARAEAADGRRIETGFSQAFEALCVRPSRTERADVESLGAQRQHQGGSSIFGS